MSRTRAGYGVLALIGAGFAAWSAIFVIMYGVQALGCRLDWQSVPIVGTLSLQRMMQVVLYLGSLIVALGLWQWLLMLSKVETASATDQFLLNVSTKAGLAALGAVAFCFAGALWLTAC